MHALTAICDARSRPLRNLVKCHKYFYDPDGNIGIDAVIQRVQDRRKVMSRKDMIIAECGYVAWADDRFMGAEGDIEPYPPVWDQVKYARRQESCTYLRNGPDPPADPPIDPEPYTHTGNIIIQGSCTLDIPLNKNVQETLQ